MLRQLVSFIPLGLAFVLLVSAATVGLSQSSAYLSSPTLSLSGQVLTSDQVPVDSCLLYLLKPDSTLIATARTDLKGSFTMRNLTAGRFTLRSVHPSYVTRAQSVSVSSNGSESVVTFVLQSKIINLTEVSIKVKRPVFELAGDRIILNVEGNPVFAGGNVTDALGMAPRVSIDPIAKTIAVDGKTGLVLYQNGRQLYLPADRIGEYLRSLPINSVSRIEVLTNPSAQYDAGGSAVILLFTRRVFQEGLTGEVSGAAGIGRYLKANGALTVSLLTPKIEGSLLYTPNYNQTYYSWKASQVIGGQIPGELGFSQSDQFNRIVSKNHMLRTSWDWNLSKTFTLGTVAQGTLVRSVDTPVATLAYQLATSGAPVIHLDAVTQLRERVSSGTVNVHAKKQSSDGRQSLSADFDVSHYTNQSTVNSDFTQLNPMANPSQAIQIVYPGSVRIVTAKADHTSSWLGKGSLETGVKYSMIRMVNRPSTKQLSPAFESIEPVLSKPYQYNESVASAYINLERNWANWFLTLGLRVEQTNYQGQSDPTTIVERIYTNLFPTVSLRHTTEKKYQYSLSANRRIVRPAFDQLNPAFIFYDPLTLYSGNPLLIPQLNTTVQASVITPKRVTATIVYTNNRNRITEVVYRLDSISATTLNRNINFDRENRMAITMSLPWRPLPVWQVQSSLTGSYTQFHSNFQDSPTTTGQATAVIRLNNGITLNKFTINVNATYRTRAVVGYMYYDPLWFLDLGLQRSFSENSTLKLAASDVFHTLLVTNYGEYLNTNIIFRHRYESQRVMLTYTYRFGNPKKRVKERSFGSDAEQSRLGGQLRN